MRLLNVRRGIVPAQQARPVVALAVPPPDADRATAVAGAAVRGDSPAAGEGTHIETDATPGTAPAGTAAHGAPAIGAQGAIDVSNGEYDITVRLPLAERVNIDDLYRLQIPNSTGQAVPIRSRYRSQSIELNDTIKWSNWTFNLGVLFSNDTLYGQGLREDSSTLSGYVAAPGNRYKMYELGWGDMIQPRVSATWAYNSKDTLYGGWARYNPAASSLPRAASWDRNLTGLFVDAHFDQNGVLFGSVPVGSSSGKLFVDDMTPRTTDEFLLGTAKQLGSRWLFRIPLEIGLCWKGRHRLSLMFDHVSNAYLASPNEGLDTLGVRYGFQF